MLRKTISEVNIILQAASLIFETSLSSDDLVHHAKARCELRGVPACEKVQMPEPGGKLDVLDSKAIWCVGKIVASYENTGHANTLLITYVGWGKVFDEFICAKSPRLAPLGFYTQRKDFPHYVVSTTQSVRSEEESGAESIHHRNVI